MKSIPNSKPSGNSSSLVSEISSRDANGTPMKPSKCGTAPKITYSTIKKNNSFVDLKNTGLS